MRFSLQATPPRFSDAARGESKDIKSQQSIHSTRAGDGKSLTMNSYRYRRIRYLSSTQDSDDSEQIDLGSDRAS